jgi:hypothetical protein
MKSVYVEGKEARKNFEEAMKKLFRAPKPPKQPNPPKKSASGDREK